MLKLFILLFFSLISAFLYAQDFQKVYSASGTDKGHAVIQTQDGGYAIAGLTNSFGAGGYDFFLIKTNSSGNIIWQKTYGGTSSEDGISIVLNETPDLGFVITGGTNSFGSVSGDCYVIKVDVTGLLLWSKKYSTSSGLETGRGIRIASNGDIIIAGTDNNDNFGSADGILLRIDNNGNNIWSKTYGGGANDHFHSIEELPGGNLIISGSTTSYGPGGTGGYVLKTDALGNVLWDFSYGGNANDGYNASALTNNFEILLTGTTNSYGAGNYDVIVTKIDTNGVVIWTKVFGGSNYERGTSVKTIPNSSDFYVVANCESFGNGNKELLVTRHDSNGNIAWSKTFGTSLNEAFDSWSNGTMTSTNDGGFVMTGWSDSLSVGGNGDEILLIKGNDIGSSLCEDVNLSILSPIINRNNPTSGVVATGNYTTVNSVETNSSFIEGAIDYCSENDPPIADFSTPITSICPNTCIEFSDLSTGSNINSYSWSFPGATPNNSTQQNPTNICYSNLGSYNVWLIITDDYGSDTLFMPSYITVNPCNPPIPDFTFTNQICVGECIDLIDESTNNPTSWSWNIAGGNPNNSTDQNPTGICFNNAGSFPITLSVINTYGTNDTTIFIDVIDIPSAGNDSIVSYCVIESDFQLTNLLNGADNNLGDWIETSTNQIINPLFSPQTVGSGVYNFSYVIFNGYCYDTSNFIITLDEVNNAGFDTTLAFCESTSPFDLFSSLSGNPDNGGYWEPSLSSGTGIYSPQNDSDGNYLYILNGGACENDTSEIITETINLSEPILNIPESVCLTVADFYLNANIQGGIWDGIGVIDSLSGLFSTNGLGVGNYNVRYTIDSLSCESSVEEIISLIDLPYINPLDDFSWCYEDELIVEVTSYQGIDFSWNTGDTSSVIQIEYENDDLGETYYYSVQVSNDCGTSEASFSIYVDICETYFYIPNAFTPNSDEFNNSFGPVFYGVPISEFQFEIYDRWGELIWQSMDISMLWDGTYNGKLCQDGVYTWTLKFSSIKELAKKVYTGHVNIVR